MKKDIIKFILLTLVIYNIIPIINKIVPESTNYTFLSDLWIVYPLYSLIISVLFCKKYGLKIMVSILLVLLFIPTMFIFYNDSVLIFIFIYPINSFSTDYKNNVMATIVSSGVSRKVLYFVKLLSILLIRTMPLIKEYINFSKRNLNYLVVFLVQVMRF